LIPARHAGHEKEDKMNRIPSLKEADELLRKYNQEPYHLRHAKIVSGVMRYFANEFDPENIDFWEIVGLLHDLDFEQFPEQHCAMTGKIMRQLDLNEKLVRAAVSHGYPTCTDIQPENVMEKILYATDELTGLIGAAAIIRPSRSVMDLETPSVMKKFKTPAFAAGCSREVISRGAEMLGWPLEDLVGRTILAMRSLSPAMEI
jgi:predicted hydrolase (HD superfamily)